MAFIGNQPAESFTSFATQEFSTSATTSYTLNHAVTNENEIALFVNNVRQQPGSGKAYTATGTALTLSAATASTDTMYCVFLGRALQTVTPATNSITAAMVSDGAITSAKLSSGKILQVVNTTKTDTFSTTSSSFADVTGLSAAITPISTSNKIFVILSIYISNDTQTGNAFCNIVRGSTELQETVVRIPQEDQAIYRVYNLSMTDFDSPSSTSSTTYKVQVKTNAGTLYVNRAANTGGFSDTTTATLTLMEIAG